MQQLIPLTDAERMQAAGLPFESSDSARWCFRHAAERGLSEAFVRIGRRVYVDPEKFHKLAAQVSRDAYGRRERDDGRST